MNYHDMEFWGNDNPSLYGPASSYHFPDLEELTAQSQHEEMKPFTPEDVAKHLFGVALVSILVDGDTQYTAVGAYAGITSVVEVGGKKLAEIGSLIRHTGYANQGFGGLVVGKLIDTASECPVKHIIGSEGFLAKCNKKSFKLFAELGFEEVGYEEGKQIMTRPLVQ